MFLTRKITPNNKLIHPTTMYPIPRNGFFPPKAETLLIIIDLVPPNPSTS